MSLVYAQAGMAVASSLTAYDTARTNTIMANNQRDTETKLSQMTQRYQNTMAAISQAQQLNAMTSNEASMRDAAIRAGETISKQSMQDKALTEASAAAAGVRGGAVRSAMNSLERSKLTAREALRKRMEAQGRANTQDRANLRMAGIYNKDVSVYSARHVRAPSAASALLGLGASLIDIYDSNQPEGSKSTDAMAGWG